MWATFPRYADQPFAEMLVASGRLSDSTFDVGELRDSYTSHMGNNLTLWCPYSYVGALHCILTIHDRSDITIRLGGQYGLRIYADEFESSAPLTIGSVAASGGTYRAVKISSVGFASNVTRKMPRIAFGSQDGINFQPKEVSVCVGYAYVGGALKFYATVAQHGPMFSSSQPCFGSGTASIVLDADEATAMAGTTIIEYTRDGEFNPLRPFVISSLAYRIGTFVQAHLHAQERISDSRSREGAFPVSQRPPAMNFTCPEFRNSLGQQVATGYGHNDHGGHPEFLRSWPANNRFLGAFMGNPYADEAYVPYVACSNVGYTKAQCQKLTRVNYEHISSGPSDILGTYDVDLESGEFCNNEYVGVADTLDGPRTISMTLTGFRNIYRYIAGVGVIGSPFAPPGVNDTAPWNLSDSRFLNRIWVAFGYAGGGGASSTTVCADADDEVEFIIRRPFPNFPNIVRPIVSIDTFCTSGMDIFANGGDFLTPIG